MNTQAVGNLVIEQHMAWEQRLNRQAWKVETGQRQAAANRQEAQGLGLSAKLTAVVIALAARMATPGARPVRQATAGS